MKPVESTNLYCYDMVASKINIGAEKAIALGGNDIIHNWSPNNIKRLIVSAEGFIVQYHVSAKNQRLVDIQLFTKKEKLFECFSNPKYKPMVQALIGSRICSSIEEIIYLTKPNQWGMSLPSSELDIKSLLNSQRVSTSADLTSEVGNRFVRLHGLVILNIGLQEFYTGYKDKLKEPLYQVSDEEGLNGSAKIVHEHWWKKTYLRGSHYSLDLDGGKLDSLFKSLIRLKDDSNRSKQLDDLRNKTLGKSVTSLKSANLSLNVMRKAVLGLRNVLKDSSLYCNAPKESIAKFFDESKLEVTKSVAFLYHFDEISEDNLIFLNACSVPFNEYEKSKLSEKDAMDYTSKAITVISVALYRAIVRFTLSTITEFGKSYPIYVTNKLKDVDRRIVVPKDMAFLGKEAEIYLGGTLDGVQQMSSLGNCLFISTLLCVSEYELPSKKDYTKDFWLSKISGNTSKGGTK